VSAQPEYKVGMRNAYNEINIERELQLLEFGDTIEVKWLDACQVRNVPETLIEHNKVFATYKKKTGQFFSVKADQLYRQRFLILIVDTYLDKRKTSQRHTIVSMPVSTIVKITLIRKSARFKVVSEIGDSYLKSKDLAYASAQEGVGETVSTEKQTGET